MLLSLLFEEETRFLHLTKILCVSFFLTTMIFILRAHFYLCIASSRAGAKVVEGVQLLVHSLACTSIAPSITHSKWSWRHVMYIHSICWYFFLLLRYRRITGPLPMWTWICITARTEIESKMVRRGLSSHDESLQVLFVTAAEAAIVTVTTTVRNQVAAITTWFWWMLYIGVNLLGIPDWMRSHSLQRGLRMNYSWQRLFKGLQNFKDEEGISYWR